MTRRSFMKGLLAFPVGLALGVKAVPAFNWKTASTILVSRSPMGVPRPMTATDILYWRHERMQRMENIRKSLAEAYFAPNPMFESLKRSS